MLPRFCVQRGVPGQMVKIPVKLPPEKRRSRWFELGMLIGPIICAIIAAAYTVGVVQAGYPTHEQCDDKYMPISVANERDKWNRESLLRIETKVDALLRGRP